METMTSEYIVESIHRTQAVLTQIASDPDLIAKVTQVAEICTDALRAGHKVILAGNGGSAADCQHFAGELVSRFNFDRPALPALALTVDTSILTSISNDYGYEHVFTRQLSGLARPGDVFIAYSTSGNSPSIVQAVKYAYDAKQYTVIGFTGQTPGAMNQYCDLVVNVPSTVTPRIQEGHAIIGHIVCDIIEQNLFSKETK